jgi:hypothetical protein
MKWCQEMNVEDIVVVDKTRHAHVITWPTSSRRPRSSRCCWCQGVLAGWETCDRECTHTDEAKRT